MNALALVDDPLFAEHEAPAGHPERSERLDAARAGLARAHLALGTETLRPRDACDEELGRVHGPGYLARLGQAAGKAGYLDADTFFSPASVAAARRAAGGAVALVDALAEGRARYGLGLVRPPGHHARPPVGESGGKMQPRRADHFSARGDEKNRRCQDWFTGGTWLG